MIKVPAKDFMIGKTEVTQALYEKVMGINPVIDSYDKDPEKPVTCVYLYEAIMFCNKLSEQCGLTPVYSINGKKKTDKWGYDNKNPEKFYKAIKIDTNADGFRLPTVAEWHYAAKGGQDYIYSGSNNLDEVGWYGKNSKWSIHKVAQKKPNGYGLYDMSGNVSEWCWDVNPRNGNNRYHCGGSCYDYDDDCKVSYTRNIYGRSWRNEVGFRIVCSASWDK